MVVSENGRVQRGTLQVAQDLDQLVLEEILPGTGVELEAFWRGLEKCLGELGPVNKKLLEIRDQLQQKIDAWHLERKGHVLDEKEYKAFLQEIGYLLPEPNDFEITTSNVDEEISHEHRDKIPDVSKLICPSLVARKVPKSEMRTNPDAQAALKAELE